MAACATSLASWPAVCGREAPDCSSEETVALQRYVELVGRQKQLIELLKVVTPEQFLSSLKARELVLRATHGPSAQLTNRPDFAQMAALVGEDQLSYLVELLTTHTIQEIAAAVTSHDKLREQQKRYYQENREKIIQRNTAYMRDHRGKSKGKKEIVDTDQEAV